MATTAPIDVEKYLLQGESGEEDLLSAAGLKRKPGTLPAKPPLEDALLNAYNKSGGPALKPGELPPPVMPPPPEPGIIDKVGGAISNAVGTAAKIPGQIYESLPSFGGGAQAPAGTTPTAPTALGTIAAPAAPEREYSSGLYGTLQRHTNFVRDVAEFGGKTLAGMGAFAFGAATAASDILNAQLARVARGGPTAGGPESSTHYRDIFTRMDKTISDLTPEPRSDVAKNLSKGVGAVTGLIRDVAELPGKGLVAVGILNEDTARVLSFGAELYLFYRISRDVREAAPELRAKIANFRTRASRATSDAEMASAAEDLANAAAKNPKLNDALDEARGKFRDEADREAGTQPRGPRPPDEGPAGGGAAIDPGELRTYNESLRQRVDELRTERPDLFERGADIGALRTELDKVPKPQARGAGPVTTIEAMEARLGEAPQPQAAPVPEVQRAAPTMERPVQPEVVVGQERAVAPVTRPAEAPAARPTTEPARTAPAAEPTRPTPADIREAVLRPETPSPAQSYVPMTPVQDTRPEAAATVTPETAPAPVSPEPTVAAVQLEARRLLDLARAPDTPQTVLVDSLRDLKTLARNSGKTVRAGLENLGFTPHEAIALEAELKKFRVKPAGVEKPVKAAADYVRPSRVAMDVSVGQRHFINQSIQLAERTGILDEIIQRSSRGQSARNVQAALREKLPETVSDIMIENMVAGVQRAFGTRRLYEQSRMTPKPAVQTAATEAVLENAPAGTEVEIPAPSEPVVDTTPVVEKPKRKRRVVKAAPETVAEQVTQLAPTAPAETGEVRYYGVRGVNMLQDFVGSVPLIRGGTTLPRAPIQVRATQGAKPDAIFIDTSGLSTRTKWSDIDVQEERGRMSEETANALRENLRRQAELSGKLVEEAHTFTGQELTREATRIAAETGIDLYVKKGKNYELVPKDVVRTDARLNRGDDLAPIPISNDAAGAYVESKTSDIGPTQIREIMDAIEQGIDITDHLPSELVPHYKAMRDAERAGIDTSERRSFIDILNDLNTMLGEQGAIGGNFTREMRMAAQRLQADMRKAGKATREFLFGARPEDVAMFENYLDRINNAPPPDSTNPRNMRFDPENIIPGDKVVKQRVASGNTYVPLWQSEVRGIQGARDIKPGGTPWDVKLPIRQHKAAGTEFLYYSYRTAQKNLNAELNGLHADMAEIGRGFSAKSLENIGANGYARQGGDGQRILTFNKVTPKPLTAAERRLQAIIDGIYAYLFNRVNETREATGREPLARVDDYQTFARTIGLLNQLGIKVDLVRDSSASIHSQYIKHRATNFPYVVRKHAFYTAEMNALKILDTYAQSALKDINLSPFLAKLHELIETKLPDPVTGKETWSLKDHKEGLYKELSRWGNYIATGTNAEIHPTARIIAQILNKNIGYATLSGLLRSGMIQVSTLVNTSQALGMTPTLISASEMLVDLISGGKKHKFALENSEILSSRKFIEAYNGAASAVVGRRPGDFFRAIARGRLGELQETIGAPGFKLLEWTDMQAAMVTWHAAYKIAKGSKMGYSHKDSVRYADDLVVRTQGSTMPGDLSGVQRNAVGKLVTQFQTFLISDWNFLVNEVLSKGKSGGGGGGNIPPGGVPSGTGSWETGGPRTKTRLVMNVVQLLIYTQIMNELYKLLHIQPAQPDPVGDVAKAVKEGSGPAGIAWNIAVGQTERIPVWGSIRYGRGVTGPAAEITRELGRSYRGDPMAPHPLEPTATILGVPYTRQTSKYLKAQKRGENFTDSLLGWYSQESGRGSRTRPERRERSSR